MTEPLWTRVDSSAHVTPPPVQPGTSPCQGCAAPCCWAVKLLNVEVGSAQDLEYVWFLSGFPEIELVYTDDRFFRVFLRRPCRHLDTASGRFDCTLHGTDDKPFICVDYDETDCFYRDNLLGPPDPARPVVRLDRRRLRAVLTLFEADERGALVRSPDPAAAWAAVRTLAPDPAPVRRVRRSTFDDIRLLPGPMRPLSDRTSPCEACTAPCCRVLIFDRLEPETVRSLEYMRYQLGFPGLEVAVTASGWRTLVYTTCEALRDDGRCALHGHPDRPHPCATYNQFSCDYRRFFSGGGGDVVRLGHDDVMRLLSVVPASPGAPLPKDMGMDGVRALLRRAAP